MLNERGLSAVSNFATSPAQTCIASALRILYRNLASPGPSKQRSVTARRTQPLRGLRTAGPTHRYRGRAMTTPSAQPSLYPVNFAVDYPDRPLNRLTTALRIFVAIPILVVLESVSGGNFSTDNGQVVTYGAGATLFLGPLLMILFRRKYPRWWFDWNLELQRFSNRVVVYLALMDDRYPSTDDHQSVHLDYEYPDASQDLNRWLPLVKCYWRFRISLSWPFSGSPRCWQSSWRGSRSCSRGGTRDQFSLSSKVFCGGLSGSRRTRCCS